jgi:hypothetical protein
MRIHDVGVARQIGPCSDAIERSPGSRMLLVTYRTPGIRPDRSPPERIEAQAEQASTNVRAALARANKTLLNLVKICSAKICQHVVSASEIAAYVEARTCALGHSRPTSTSSLLLHLLGHHCPMGSRQLQRMHR